MKRIILTGGGTGGHLFPLVAVAEALKRKQPDTELIFFGPNGLLEKKIFSASQIPMVNIYSGKLRRYWSWKNILDIIKVPIGLVQCLFYLLKYMPDAIFAKGGYASVPVVLIGWLYRIPILIHESDSIPGLANRFLSKFSRRVAVTYAEAEKYFNHPTVVLTGVPVRPDINKGEAQKARDMFNLSSDRPVIFVWGGSQGAAIINNTILRILPELLEKYQVIHQTGEKNLSEVEKIAQEMNIKPGENGYHPVAFIGEELKDILAVSDLVISRAGANSIAEIAIVGKPSILIPIKNSANNHQEKNAYTLSREGAAVMLTENNLGQHLFKKAIDDIIDHEEKQKELAERIVKFSHPEAAENIAQGIISMIE